MKKQLGTNEYYCSAEETKGDLLVLRNMIPIGNVPLVKVRIGEVADRNFHIFMQAVFLQKKRGRQVHVAVVCSPRMQPPVRRYCRRIGIDDRVFLFETEADIQELDADMTIEIDRYLDGNLFLVDEGQIISNTINSICSVLESL